jgi:hypothetical protein
VEIDQKYDNLLITIEKSTKKKQIFISIFSSKFLKEKQLRHPTSKLLSEKSKWNFSKQSLLIFEPLHIITDSIQKKYKNWQQEKDDRNEKLNTDTMKFSVIKLTGNEIRFIIFIDGRIRTTCKQEKKRN